MSDYYVDKNGKVKKKKKKEAGTHYYVDKKGKVTKEVIDAPVKGGNKDSWFKSGGFSDGVDGVGDFLGDLGKSVVGTVGDIGVGVGKGLTRLGEGIGDATRYGIAGIADATGHDNYAERLRKSAKEDDTEKIWGKAEKKVDNWSVLGNKSDKVSEGLGQVAGIILTGGVAGGLGAGAGLTTAITTGTIGVSGVGSGISQAYQSGASDKDAYIYGGIAGTAEALTEMMFGGLGRTVKATGLSKGLLSVDDMLAKKVSGLFSSQIAKNFAEFGIKASAEGTEEVLAGIAQAVGKKITYMEDKELKDILKDENLLEQFIVGSVTSGIAQSGIVPGMSHGSLIKSNMQGRDYITGLTQNEQKVIDKEYKNRISEAEKDGKTLSKKDKTKIYDEVLNDLDKGYISIDTIESALGDETYNTYKNMEEQENSIREEIESLENTPENQFTIKQRERLTELRDKLKTIERAGLKNKVREQLSNEVSELAKDSRLSESYNEKSRRSQAFEADLSKYDENQQETIQRAIDSGILNNTNRTHEFVDMVAKISSDKGVLFDFTNNQKLKDTGFAIEGKTVNGYKTNDGKIGINIDSRKSLNSVVGHEITHVLEGTELYTELQEAVTNYAKTKGDYDTRYNELAELYKDIEDANIEGEVTADLVGDYLFTDKKFVNNLSVEKPNIFKKIYNEIKYLCKIATAGSKEARQLEKVKRTFEKAYQENVRNTSIDTKVDNKLAGELETQEVTKLNTEQDDIAPIAENPIETGDIKYSFSGTRAKTANKSLLHEAEHMLDTGVDSETVRQETGWFKGYDGKMRFEIDDSQMEVYPNGDATFRKAHPEYVELEELKKKKDNSGITKEELDILNKLENLYGYEFKRWNELLKRGNLQLENILEHDKLYASYPELKDIDIEIASAEDSGSILGGYNPRKFSIIINEKMLDGDVSELKKTLIHEIQHAIQDIENFTQGSSKEFWQDKIDDGHLIKTNKQNTEIQKLKKEYSDISKSEPEFFKEMNELEEMTPTVDRGAYDFETFEQIEEDPIEWQNFDKKRDLLSEKYGEDKVFDFMDLQYNIKELEKKGITASDAYYKTAGEIEARDTANRLSLNEEQRKATRPDIDREDVVFSDNAKYSLSDNDNKNIKVEVNDFYGGEMFATMSYTQDGKTVGTIEYSEYDGKPNVKMIEVEPEYRRKGIATKLLQELQKKYPDAEINYGMTTPDGSKLLESITYDVTDEAIVADKQKLQNLQTELNELQERLDVLYDMEHPIAEQVTELRKLGDRWNEVYDNIRELESTLKGKKATKTFVKTDTKYSLSDSDGKTLTKEQQEYFKDSKMVDENGNLKVMYHGSENGGFHEFSNRFSDDGRSFFFVDTNVGAKGYSGTHEVYEAKTFHNAEDVNNFLEEVNQDEYEVAEENGEFVLYEDGDEVARSDSAKGIYDEFCDWTGLGTGSANYKVYLNLKNPLVVDAKNNNWDELDLSEFTGEESEYYNNTREFSEYAKEQGYDGVIFKNIIDTGLYASGKERFEPATVAVAFDSNQIKSTANVKPTTDDDIRYSLSADSNGRKLSEEQKEYFKDTKVVDENGNLKVMYHGTSNGGHTVFDTYGSNFGLFGQGTYFTDNKSVAESYTNKGKGNNKQVYEAYLNIKNPMDMDAQANVEEWQKAFPEADFSSSKTNEDCFKAMKEYFFDNEYTKYEAYEEAWDAITGMGYDGLTHIGGGRFNKADDTRHRVYIAYEPEQIKNIDNTKPTDNADINLSMTNKGQNIAPYGNYNVYGKDIALQQAPVEEVAPVQETTPVQQNTQAIDYAPLTEEQANERDAEQSLTSMESEEFERVVQSYMDDAPAYMFDEDEIRAWAEEQARQNPQGATSKESTVIPESPLEERDIYTIGRERKTNAYMYENPEVKPFFQQEAQVMLAELQNSVKGERARQGSRYGIDDYGIASDEGWYGTKRQTSEALAYLRDNFKYDTDDLTKGLKAIIEDHGAENNAISKRIEFLIDERLREGYKDFMSNERMPANQDYINLLNEKQITEYNDEAFNNWVQSLTDEDIPPVQETIPPIQEDIAPIQEGYEAIEPEPQKLEGEEEQWARNKMQRADKPPREDGLKERRWAETSTESSVVDRRILPKDLDQNAITYQPISNKKTLNNANAMLDRDGYDASVEYFNSQFKNKRVSLDDIALGERLIQEAVKKGDMATAGELIQNVSILGTELGQKVQALSIIQRLTPEGQLKMLNKIVERGKAKGDKAFEDVEITQDMIDHILKTYGKDGTYNQEELNKAVEDVKQQIADQMKVTMMDKVNAWRYLSMLGNVKTHGRNIISNVGMRGTMAVKDALARTIETIAPIKNRTKTWKLASADVKEFAKQTTKEMEAILADGSKYSETGDIKAKRQIFKNKILNSVYEFNSNMLTKEDWWFQSSAFNKAFRDYLTANGIRTNEDIQNNAELIEKAKAYATEQSQIATFKQYSFIANKLREIEKKNTATEIAVGAIVPFKNTPINIAKTGLNYSPLGFAKTLTYDVSQVKNGNMEASEMIDHLSQNITGTGLALLGYALAMSGFLNGAGKEDKEGKYDYQLGKQAYSVNIGGKTYSLSWLTPMAMPLFVGANAFEILTEGKEWDGNVVIEALTQTLDPMSEMSVLSGLTNVLSSYEKGSGIWADIAQTTGQNYVTQFVPTLSSQVATFMDDKQRSTKVAGNSDFKFLEETVNKLKLKIPGLRETLEPATDVWGREVKLNENKTEKAFETFIAPYSRKENIATQIDEELKDLYSDTGDAGLFPQVPRNSVNYDGEKYDMSAKEYTSFKKTYGQNALELMEELFRTTTYQNADATDKAEMVDKVYDYANDEAKREYLAKQDIEYTNATKKGKAYYKENNIKGAIENDMPLDEFDFYNKYPKKYKFLQKNNVSYDEYTKDKKTREAYNWAYENPEKYTLSKAVSNDIVTYKSYTKKLSKIKSDKDKYGKSITGSRKQKVADYINGLDADYGERLILFKSEYNADDTYNYEIIDYLNNREDITFDEMNTILKELGFTVTANGDIYWK